jgi:protein TonB
MAQTIEPAKPITHATDTPTEVSTESTAQNTPSNELTSILEQAALADAAPAQMAAISQAPSTAPSRRDYGWLSEAILRRVEELKRYPASARVDRAEGKVVIKAVITEDGNLGEVEVFQSSGHPTLDKAAIDTMRQAAPFHLPHPLGQPRMTIKIPMSYRLDR